MDAEAMGKVVTAAVQKALGEKAKGKKAKSKKGKSKESKSKSKTQAEVIASLVERVEKLEELLK